jgi:hypothetical protein
MSRALKLLDYNVKHIPTLKKLGVTEGDVMFREIYQFQFWGPKSLLEEKNGNKTHLKKTQNITFNKNELLE